MGYGSCGTDSNGRPIGYNYEATCDAYKCDVKIDRGLDYACGGTHGEDDFCCEKYFCHDHLSGGAQYSGNYVSVCANCDQDDYDDEGDEDLPFPGGFCQTCGCVSYPIKELTRITYFCTCCATQSTRCPTLYPNLPSRAKPPVDRDKALRDARTIFEAKSKQVRDMYMSLATGKINPQPPVDPKEGWDGGTLSKLLYDKG